jgi:hypothetical protein
VLKCNGQKPWQRLIATHSVLAHQLAREKGWLQGEDLTEAETNAEILMEFSLDNEAQDRLRTFLNIEKKIER